MKRRKTKYHCRCWMCTSAKKKKDVAREKEKRLFRCGYRSRLESVLSVNTSESDGV